MNRLMGEELQRILIIDDEPVNILLLGNILKDSYHILIALDGKNGIKLARAKPAPDLIMLDIMMPEMDGYEVCKILQADLRTKDIPVIFVTALNTVVAESEGLALGVVDYICKPFTNAVIKARVKTHLHLKMQRDMLLEQRQQLESYHQRNLMILDTVSEGIFGIDTHCNITFINPAALQMLGYTEDDVLGKNCCSVMHHTKPDGGQRAPEECLAYEAMLTGHPLETHQDQYWHRNHTSFPVSFSAAPAIENNTIIGAVIVFKDITRKLQLEQDLYKADKIEAFQVLAGGLAHDLNNLLMVIIANLDLLLWEEDAESKLNEYLLPCKKAAMSATDLAAKFLTIAKNDKFATSTIDIKEAVYQVTASLPTNQPIDYEVTVSDDAWPLIADAVQFLQLLKNIVTNGQEAMPEGGRITIRVTNCLDCAKQPSHLAKGRYLQLSIQDQGPGIPEEQKKRIFDPYFSTKDRGNQKGMGLGLTICNAIMENHNGALDLQQGSEEGTVVHLYFPVVNEHT